jgi:hypothetical protein
MLLSAFMNAREPECPIMKGSHFKHNQEGLILWLPSPLDDNLHCCQDLLLFSKLWGEEKLIKMNLIGNPSLTLIDIEQDLNVNSST